jgi:hypothetical protein
VVREVLSMNDQFCARCLKETGKQIPAAHVSSLGPECERHFHGGNLAAIAACRKTNLAVAPDFSRPEGKMKNDDHTCSECGRTHWKINGICKKCAAANGAARGGKQRRASKTKALARAPRPNGGPALPTLTLTPQLSAAIWAAIPLDKQAALLDKLQEV